MKLVFLIYYSDKEWRKKYNIENPNRFIIDEEKNNLLEIAKEVAQAALNSFGIKQ